MSAREIVLSNGMVALVDADDYEEVSRYKWNPTLSMRHVYARRSKRIGKRVTTVIMHREILKAPKDMVVDHINGNTLDNRKANLRICTNRENLGNRKLNKNNTSGYRGVTKVARDGKWRASVACRVIGDYVTAEAAAKAYDRHALKEYGKFAKLNFPQPL